MNGLPKGFQPEFLIGRVLEVVCFTEYQLYLHLSSGCIITVESTVAVGHGSPLRLPKALEQLYDLIGKKVETVTGTKDGTLMLTFEQHLTLAIFDSNRGYESYSIAEGGKVIAIV